MVNRPVKVKVYFANEALKIEVETQYGWDESEIPLQALAIALEPFRSSAPPVRYKRERSGRPTLPKRDGHKK